MQFRNKDQNFLQNNSLDESVKYRVINNKMYFSERSALSPIPVMVNLTLSLSPSLPSHSLTVPIGQIYEQNSLLNTITPKRSNTPITIWGTGHCTRKGIVKQITP